MFRGAHDLPRICVGVGSNEEPEFHVPHALDLLVERFGSCLTSTTWASAPVGGTEDDAIYHNLAVMFRTTLSWPLLRDELRVLEARAGRRREAGAGVTLDLDRLMLLDGPHTVLADELEAQRLAQLPHVLAPLAELLPDWVHPQTGTTLAALARRSQHTIDGMTVVRAGALLPGDDEPCA